MKKFVCALVAISSFSFLASAELDKPQNKVEGTAHTLVLFGSTGDLAKRKIIPALVQLEKKGELPNDFLTIGIGRRDWDDAKFQEEVSAFLKNEDRPAWESLKGRVVYLKGSFEEKETYQKLAERVSGTALYYLSTPPEDFSPIVKNMDREGLLREGRVVVEKPFGRDLDSARQLETELSRHLSAEQVFRMDHYLGYESVQQWLAFRKENPPIETVWNSRYIDHVRIVMAEEVGVGTRANFWEQTGLVRDVVQNHVMQMASLIGMELPHHLTADEIQKEKVRFLESLEPFPLNQIEKYAERGQYGAGTAEGKQVPGYREEQGVPQGSNKETFVSAKLVSNSPRWEGVPFIVESGKRLSKKASFVEIVFKEKSPIRILRFEVAPKEKISVVAEPDFKEKTYLEFQSYRTPYEALLLEAIRGDGAHFVSFEELELSWRLWTPLIEYWESHPAQNFPNYVAGSDGP